MAGGQLVLVLLGVGGGDGEQWLLVLERIAEEAFGVHRGGARLEAACPGRDAAVGIAFLLRTEGGQAGTQLGRFLFGNGGHDTGGQQRQRQGAGFDDHACFHGIALCRSRLRSSRRN
ncbi:hypothetical protein FQZ97_1190300 [compost metagenome]